jgi:hypothetical protein
VLAPAVALALSPAASSRKRRCVPEKAPLTRQTHRAMLSDRTDTNFPALRACEFGRSLLGFAPSHRTPRRT